MVIATERLELRPLGMGHVEELVALHSDPEVSRFTVSFDRHQAERRLEEIQRQWQEYGYGLMAMHLRRDGQFVGRTGLNWWPQFSETEIGWIVARQQWGNGYATEAARAVLEWGFANVPAPYITAMIHPQNVRSLRVAGRLGFRRLRDDVLLGTPVIVHAISPAERA